MTTTEQEGSPMETTTVLISGDWELAPPMDSAYTFAFEAEQQNIRGGHRRMRFFVRTEILEAIAARQILLQQATGFEHQQIHHSSVEPTEGFFLPDYMGMGARWISPDADMLAATGASYYDVSATGIDFYPVDPDEDHILFPIRSREIVAL